MAITKSVPTSRFLFASGTKHCLALNGSSDYVTLPLTPSTSGFSIAMWVKVLPGAANGGFVSGWNTNSDTDGFQLKIDTGAIDYVATADNGSNPGAVLVSGNGTLVYNTWQHVALTWSSGGILTMYLNGVVVSVSGAETMTSTSNLLTLGAAAFVANYLKCRLAYVTFQNGGTPWTQTQIVSLCRQNVIPSGAGQYTFNSTVNDQNGANAATLHGTSYVVDCPFPSSRNVASGRHSASAAGATKLVFQGDYADSHITPVSTEKLQFGATSDFSCGAYVYLTPKTGVNNTDNHCLFNCDLNFGNNLGYAFQVHPTDGGVDIIVGNNFYTSSAGLVSHKVWTYVIFTVTGTTAKMYVDGTLAWTVTINRVATGGSLTSTGIGYEYGGLPLGRGVQGFMRDCFAVQSLLSQAQVTSIVSSGIYPTLDFHYKLNEGISEIAVDYSGNNLHGTINAYPPVWTKTGRTSV